MSVTDTNVPSPCILVCQLHPASQICMGCLRTRDEIAHWSRADDDYKREVLNQLEERKALGKALFTNAS